MAKRGRPKGQSTHTYTGSFLDQLAGLGVGQSIINQCESREAANKLSRRVSKKSRYPDNIKDYLFSCTTYTAISSKDTVVFFHKITRKQ